ncbi:class I SAM-dependent methyltransferase [Catenovulum sediminis]|uniref:class I SAM-dependent methyltransferase n=1 Tax=Catenovulum sediminis TaxID=1740262 RepID=UPI00117E5E8F|nr:class I SAM-dependent methyltransferase [Catenovulum sediminis]
MFSKTTDYYNNNAREFYNSTVLVDLSALYSEFLPLIKSAGVILDAGCGSGRDAFYFKQQGYLVEAFDASAQLAAIATEHLQQPVETKTFQQLCAQNKYHGIWCCASLLHVTKAELPLVFAKLAAALKNNGVMYVSFKYGETERVDNGRNFTDLTDSSLAKLISQQPDLVMIKHWQSADQRPNRSNEIWLNALIQKVDV